MNANFPPTSASAHDRIAAIDATAYAKTRNFLGGAVTALSPYITHGFVPLPDIVAAVEARFSAEEAEKLISEFGWREFFMHAWQHAGDGILRDTRPALTGVRYANAMPGDILTAQTGVPVIDESIKTLYATGYLHNHARMWIASYVVHLRKVHWRVGADWMYGYLLDGDLGSNHLSWQWVAGTFSAKPYLFNAENVARFAPNLASPGTAIDASYAALEQIARSSRDVGAKPRKPKFMAVSATPRPALFGNPMDIAAMAASANFVTQLALDAQTPVRLVHPWMLADQPTNQTSTAIGIIHLPFHAQFPWSAARWAFVITRMQSLVSQIYVGDVHALLAASPHATAHTQATLNAGYTTLAVHAGVTAQRYPKFAPEPASACGSFTQFWRDSGRAVVRKKTPR